MDDPEFDDSSEDNDHPSPDFFFLTAIGFEMGLGVLAIVVGLVVGPMANATVPPLAQWWSIFWGIGLGTLLALPMVGLVQWLQTLKIPQVEEINQFGKEHLLPMIQSLTTAELAVVSICAGVGEELLFRGWLQTWITGTESEWTPASIAIGIGIASLAFGVVHAITKLYVVVVSLMGIVFGIMLVTTGNLLVPIAAHAVFDFIQLQLAAKEIDS